jgi:hypothetical protein
MAAVQASGGAAERATTLGGPQQTLREATAAVDGDWETGAPLSTARSSCALVGESLEFSSYLVLLGCGYPIGPAPRYPPSAFISSLCIRALQ